MECVGQNPDHEDIALNSRREKVFLTGLRWFAMIGEFRFVVVL